MNKKRFLSWLFVVLMMTMIFASVSNAASTKTVTYEKAYTSLVGLTVVTSDATTWFTYDGSYLLADPHGVDNDHWALPPNMWQSVSQGWDWYYGGSGGYHNTGRSYVKNSYVFGVPTPWGAVGSHFTSTIRTSVSYDGSTSAF